MPSRRVGQFRLKVWTNDHSPRHVHALTSDGEVVIFLGEGGSVAIREIKGRISNRDVARALDAVVEHFDDLVKLWEQIHGED